MSQKIFLTNVAKGLVRIKEPAVSKGVMAFWKDLSKLAKGQAQDVVDLSVRKGKNLTLFSRAMETIRFWWHKRKNSLAELNLDKAKHFFDSMKIAGPQSKAARESAKLASMPDYLRFR